MKNTRYFLFGLSAVCVCMIGITSLNGSLLNPLRNAVGYVLVPIQSGINAVGGSIYKEASALGSLKDAMKENETLKAQVDELTEENTRLRAEQQELERLRELYELDTQYMQYQKVGARIIAKDSGNWFSVFRIDKGADDGIKENMNVSGDLKLFKEGRLNLGYMEKDDDIRDGDMIVTSNISEKFLPGILIGYATDITVDYNDNLTKSGYVIPVAQFDRLQEVLVITDLKEAGPEFDE